MTQAAIFGVEGWSLTQAERAFFKETNPWGFILFARNVETPAQLAALTESLREILGRDVPVLIDQEGGRVARLGAPHWTVFPPAFDQCEHLGAQAERAMWLRARLIAHELRACGIDGNCTPLGDIAQEHTHPVLRNRTYGRSVARVTRLARANADGTAAGGVLPVLKHIPGHGRATKDSHHELPSVDAALTTLEAEDFAVFRQLNDLPLGMSAHVVYDALDPKTPCTTSPTGITYIRENIGFGGLLMTDDISMNALQGTVAQRSVASLKAGCDLILHCNGDLAEMQSIAEILPRLTTAQLEKTEATLAKRDIQPADIAALRAEYAALMEGF